MIVAEESYETTQPTIDSNIVKLKSTSADVFFNVTTPKFAAQAIKKMAEIDWKPLHFLNNVSASIGSVMKPAGFENAQGIISSAYLKDTSDPQWKDDAGMKAFDEFLARVFPRSQQGRSLGDVRLHGRAGPRPCAEGLRRRPHAGEHHEAGGQHQRTWSSAACCRASKVKTSATDFAPISQLQLMKFKGENWDLFGEIISGDVGG